MTLRNPADWRRDDTLTFIGVDGAQEPWLIENVDVSQDKKRVTVQLVAYDAPPPTPTATPVEPVALDRFATSVPEDWR